MTAPYLIGIDVGTTSVKAALFDLAGRTVRRYGQGYPTERPAPSHVQQDPRHWMDHVLSALASLTEGLPDGAVAAAGLCSQVNTHVFVDAQGNALMPAMTWQDGRAAAEATSLDAQVAESDRLRWWGAPLPIDASHPLSRMAWVKAHHPDIWDKTRWVMLPKDYCLLHLTGEAVTDPMSNFGLVDGSLGYIPDLLVLVDGAARRVPPLSGFTASAGRIRPGLPGAGIPMVTATMDAWAGILGAGGCNDGDAAYLSGTSEVGAIVSSRKVPTPGVIAFPRCEGIVLHAGPTQSGGASVAWLSGILRVSPEEISALAAQSGPDKPTPIFLPHLQGERAPLWDIAARGSFAGLDSSMGAPEMARAVLEGVAYSVKLLMQSLEQSADLKAETLRHAGGGAASDVWCQIRANVLGRTIARTAALDSGLLGAAILAGIGAGLFPSIPDAARNLVTIEREFTPDPVQVLRHEKGFARYLDLYQRLRASRSLASDSPSSRHSLFPGGCRRRTRAFPVGDLRRHP